jgi:hypothetical protein
MTLSTLTWFTIGACVVYMVAIDANVYPWMVLQSKRLTTELSRRWYMLRYNPDSPWVRYEVERNAKKMAEDLIKEYENK